MADSGFWLECSVDGSTQTYLNADIAAKLDLHWEIQKSQVNVINWAVATFQTAPLEFTSRSMNGQVKTVIETFTIHDVNALRNVQKCP